MFIDIHVHTRSIPGPLRHGKPAYATPPQLLERYDPLGIEAGVLLPGVSPECSFVPQSNQEILEICRAYPGRFIPFCNVDPRAVANASDAPLGHLLDFYRERGYKGIGEVTANLPFGDPKVQNLFRHVERTGFPLTFHIAAQIGGIYGLYDDPGLPQLERSLACFPKLTFFAHSQAFWAEMGRLEKPGDRYGYPAYPIREEGVVPKLFRQYPNLHGDLSAGSGCNALRRDPDYAVKFLSEFHDRLLFGTDICAPDTPTPLVDFLLDLRRNGKISESVFQKVARENARRLLNLEAPAS
ncbi:MAG: amidohydrolase [Lentisphaerae bacterium]|jgi:predicted TIM-barrel fold metal-dependent hydrolase|nr:amidohydrolase [Lentisphaerota bacterium]